MDIQSLLTSDQQLLLAMNGSDSLFLDQLALILTSAWTWVPLYASLLYLVVKNNEKAGQIILTVISALLCVGIVTGIDNGLVKPEVARLRPSFEPALEGLVRTVDGYRGERLQLLLGPCVQHLLAGCVLQLAHPSQDGHRGAPHVGAGQ